MVLLGRTCDRGPGVTLVYIHCKVRYGAMAPMGTKRTRKIKKKSYRFVCTNIALGILSIPTQEFEDRRTRTTFWASGHAYAPTGRKVRMPVLESYKPPGNRQGTSSRHQPSPSEDGKSRDRKFAFQFTYVSRGLIHDTSSIFGSLNSCCSISVRTVSIREKGWDSDMC